MFSPSFVLMTPLNCLVYGCSKAYYVYCKGSLKSYDCNLIWGWFVTRNIVIIISVYELKIAIELDEDTCRYWRMRSYSFSGRRPSPPQTLSGNYFQIPVRDSLLVDHWYVVLILYCVSYEGLLYFVVDVLLSFMVGCCTLKAKYSIGNKQTGKNNYFF